MKHQIKMKIGLDLRALALFLLVMAPNLLWFAVPAPSDVLRAASTTPALDAAAAVLQVLLALTLCGLVRRDAAPPNRRLLRAALACLLLYYAGWGCYYAGVVRPAVLWTMTLAPCLSFLLFALARQNRPAAAAVSLFTVCHLLQSAAR